MKITMKSQRGATLLVTLIILILMTLMIISAFKLNKGNNQIVGNMQQRNQVLVAAQNSVETMISNPGVACREKCHINSPEMSH